MKSTGIPRSFLALCKSDVRRWMTIWHPVEPTTRTGRYRVGVGLIWNYCGLRATLLYRLNHALWQARIPALPGIIGRLNLTLYGIDIPGCVPFGSGIYIPHPVGTVVMAERIGENITLISGITIGMRADPAFPTIGDGVFIGAGARILGNLTIGSGAKIGANAVVMIDVPDGVTAVGVPAILKYPGPPADTRNRPFTLLPQEVVR